MDPKTSLASTVEILPVCVSGRNSSNLVPLETIISCCRAPEKLPTIAWVATVGGCNVKLYKCMLASTAYNVELRSKRSRNYKQKVGGFSGSHGYLSMLPRLERQLNKSSELKSHTDIDKMYAV